MVHEHGADEEGDGEVGAGAMPVTSVPGHEGEGVVPPSEEGTPSASTRVSFAGGLHLHINTQAEQVSRASWFARGYEDRLCKLLVDMGVSEREVSPQAPMDMVGVLSCPPNSFGRHTSLLVTRAGSILQAYARMGLPVLRPSPVTTLVVVEEEINLPPPPPLLVLTSLGSLGPTSEELEAAERVRQMYMFLDVLPPSAQWLCVDVTEGEWARYPYLRQRQLLTKHLCSFSSGSMSSSRRAICRLRDWLELEGLLGECYSVTTGYSCSGGTLSSCAIDAQEASRNGGRTVPHSLLVGWDFARRHAAQTGLSTQSSAIVNICSLPAVPPTPARALTVNGFYHFMFLACHAESAIVREYAALFVLCSVAALRVRDAQRARVTLRGGYVAGNCFTSKHPKRRAAMPMPFYAVRTGLPLDWSASPALAVASDRDFMFRAVKVPRKGTIADPHAVLLSKPASSANVVRALRWVLTLPPLSMTALEARSFSGHSLRHLLPTLARFFGLSIEDRNELARWAAAADTKGRRASMPNLYASEAEAPRILAIQRDIFARLVSLLCSARSTACLVPAGALYPLPLWGGWDELQSLIAAQGGGSELPSRFVSPDLEVGGEPDSSESDDD